MKNLQKTEVDTLVNFSIMMGSLSQEGKLETMEKIMSFIKTGDESLLPIKKEQKKDQPAS